MKTKIVYISGGEIFDMNDIHAALNQVRDALNLGTDTVLFGVPVDASDALAHEETQIPSITVDVADIENATELSDAIPTVDVEPVPEIDTPITTVDIEYPAPVADVAPAPAPKKSRGRPKSAKKVAESPAIVDASSQPDDTIVDTEPENTAPETPNVSSILSVLTSKSEIEDDPVVETESENIPEIAAAEIASAPSDYAEPQTDVISEFDTIDTVQVELDTAIEIDDNTDVESMITTDAPEVPVEKTLEQLLESMTPLREDIEHEQSTQSDVPMPEFDNFADDSKNISDGDMTDTDMTLEQLATEFAENQDKIEPVQKTENHGKIGKLKNILPFKKARRDDTGLMGDLFGWAGIAANDEDFTIPGFFTNAASKK